MRTSKVYVVSPGGWTGKGGIQSYSRTLVRHLNEISTHGATLLDSRGAGPAWISPLFVLLTCLRIAAGRSVGNSQLLHIQVSERGSFLRKLIVIWLAQLLRIPVVLHHHGAEAVSEYRSASALGRWIIERATKAASINIVLGRPWRDWLIDEVGVGAGRVHILYNGIPDIEIGPRPNSQSAGPFRPVLLAVMIERKGVADFIRAVAEVAKHTAVRATIAGDGKDLVRFEILAKELDIDAHFVGWVGAAEVPSLLADHEVYVLPSYNEGLPLGILEAMRAGLPVVTTPVGAIPEAFPPGSGVILVPPGDVPALAGELLRLATDGALREELSRQSRAAFISRFSIESHMEQLLHLYSKISKL